MSKNVLRSFEAETLEILKVIPLKRFCSIDFFKLCQYITYCIMRKSKTRIEKAGAGGGGGGGARTRLRAIANQTYPLIAI